MSSMFTATTLRRTAAVVLIAFGNLIAQPVIAALNTPAAAKPRQKTAEERHGQNLERMREHLERTRAKQDRNEDDSVEMAEVLAQGEALEASKRGQLHH